MGIIKAGLTVSILLVALLDQTDSGNVKRQFMGGGPAGGGLPGGLLGGGGGGGGDDDHTGHTDPFNAVCDCHHNPYRCGCKHGECSVDHHGVGFATYSCTCDTGFTGEFCDITILTTPVTTVAPQTVSNEQCHYNGYINSHGVCVCDEGYSGKHCQHELTEAPPTTNSPQTATPSPTLATPHPPPTTIATPHAPPTTMKTPSPLPTTVCGNKTESETIRCVYGTCVEMKGMRSDEGGVTWACLCEEGWVGQECDIRNNDVTSTVESETLHVCESQSTLDDINSDALSSDPNAMTCSSTGSHESHEAFVYAHCPDVPRNSSVWKYGLNVGESCDRIPPYTAVAAFYKGHYSAKDSISGILLNCTDTGFLLAVQQCDIGIDMVEINHDGINLMDADMYYTII